MTRNLGPAGPERLPALTATPWWRGVAEPVANQPDRGVVLEEMDTDAVIARRPQVALVDELAHTNAPGSKYEKRWQDVEAILAAGITVISTLNIQHMESLNDVVAGITGVRVRETVPDAVVDGADAAVGVETPG